MNSPQAIGKFEQLSGSSQLPFPSLDSSGTTYSSCAHCTGRTENNMQQNTTKRKIQSNTQIRMKATHPHAHVCYIYPHYTKGCSPIENRIAERKLLSRAKWVACCETCEVLVTKIKRNVISSSSREKRVNNEKEFTHAFSASLTSALASASDIPSPTDSCPIGESLLLKIESLWVFFPTSLRVFAIRLVR